MTEVAKIEVCVSNLKLGSKIVCDLIRETYPTIIVKQYACLGHCDRCIKVPYVLIDDHNFIEAENAQALWEKVKAFIDSKREG